MRICLMCDLHLPYHPNAVQYDAFRYFLKEIKKEQPDFVVFAGDYSANGNACAVQAFYEGMESLGIPYAVIPGNSDLRSPETSEFIYSLACEPKQVCKGQTVWMINDSDGVIGEKERMLLQNVGAEDIVVMHHPSGYYLGETGKFLTEWRRIHPENLLFCGHLHKAGREGNDILLRAADPDKAIGACPCITFFDTEDQKLNEVSFPCPFPDDFMSYLGVSCYDPKEDIPYAAEHHLSAIELRPNAVREDREALLSLIEAWRKSGGRLLSVHAPDMKCTQGTVTNTEEWESFAGFVREINADRVTLHVPKCSVTVFAQPEYRDNILGFAGKMLSGFPAKTAVGIENMHMEKKETPEKRRFGYLPEEVKEYADLLSEQCGRRIFCHLDVGHARNNAPFSEKYNLGAWYAEIGDRINGYHIHQVIQAPFGFLNHRPITELYGSLISYASFFYEWEKGGLNKAPVFLEIREPGEYRRSVELFEKADGAKRNGSL